MRDRKLRHKEIRWTQAVYSSGLGLDIDILLRDAFEFPRGLAMSGTISF